MSDSISLKIRGIKATVKNLDELKKGVNEQADNLLELAATKFQTRAQELETAVDTGTGRRSIHVASPDEDHRKDYEEAHRDAPGDTAPIEKINKSKRIGLKIQLFIGTWLGYMSDIHRKGGIDGKGKQFLRKAYKQKREEVKNWYGREIGKLLEKYRIMRGKI